jgi:hypothetical protein
MWPEMICFFLNERSNLIRQSKFLCYGFWIVFLSKDVKYFEANRVDYKICWLLRVRWVTERRQSYCIAFLLNESLAVLLRALKLSQLTIKIQSYRL